MTSKDNIDVNAMNEDALRALCSQLLAERETAEAARADERAAMDERMASLYHPDFGSAWMETGEIGRAVLSAQAQGLERAIRLITPPKGAVGDAAVVLGIAVKALQEHAGDLNQRARNSATVAKLRFADRKNA